MVQYNESEEADRVALLEAAEEPVLNWVSARDLRPGALLAYPRMIEGSQGVSVGRARLLGLYLAEGNLVRQNGKYRCVEFSFSLAEKDSLARETKNLLANEMGVASSIYLRPRSKQCQVRTSWNAECVGWFKRYGGHYSWAKRLDPEVLTWDDASLKNLVGGWFDGDGCLDRKNGCRVVVATVSDDLASQMRMILCRLGVYHTWRMASARENVYRGIVVSHRRAHYLTVPRGHSAELLSWTSRWDGVIPKIRRNSKKNLSDKHVLYRISRIERIREMNESDNPMDVYCLEVENDHSFVVQNAVAVENCLADYVQCSKCGKVLGDNDPNCRHIESELLHNYYDKDGTERVIAELCGRLVKKNGKWEGDPKSVKFIEASWVDKPAFYGAVLNHYVAGVPKEAERILAFPTSKLQECVDDIFKMRVADRAGMLVLRVARAELLQRRREAMIERLIRSL